jgi:hypothetical protein
MDEPRTVAEWLARGRCVRDHSPEFVFVDNAGRFRCRACRREDSRKHYSGHRINGKEAARDYRRRDAKITAKWLVILTEIADAVAEQCDGATAETVKRVFQSAAPLAAQMFNAPPRRYVGAMKRFGWRMDDDQLERIEQPEPTH